MTEDVFLKCKDCSLYDTAQVAEEGYGLCQLYAAVSEEVRGGFIDGNAIERHKDWMCVFYFEKGTEVLGLGVEDIVSRMNDSDHPDCIWANLEPSDISWSKLKRSAGR